MQDRSIYEDAEVFAHNLNLQGYLTNRDYETYRTMYLTISEFLPPPDLGNLSACFCPHFNKPNNPTRPRL